MTITPAVLLSRIRRLAGGRASEGRKAPREWRGVVRSRLLVCAALLACWTVSIEARLVYLQFVDHGDLMARADRQQLRTVEPPAKRGEILDRNGHVLAYKIG